MAEWPYTKCAKTVEVRCSNQELTPFQLKIATDEIREKQIYRERNNIKARVSKMAKGLQGPAEIESMSPY